MPSHNRIGILRVKCILVCVLAAVFLSEALLFSSEPALPAPGALGATGTEEGLTASAQSNAVTRIKHPVSWLTWGFDLRVREEYHYNARTLGGDIRGYKDNEYNYQRFRPRLWTTLSPLEHLELDAGVAMEFRTYSKPEDRAALERDELIVERLAMRFKDIGPAQLTAGRQTLWLGNRWLIWDATPRDGSRTDFFDAARLTLNWQAHNTTFDIIGFDDNKDVQSRIPPVNPYPELRYLSEQDENGLILYVQNRSLPKTQLDAYFVYRHEDNPLSIKNFGNIGDTGDFFLFGARAEGEFSDHWQYRTEFAPELGTKNGETLSAFGINSRLSYFVKDPKNHNFRLFHEFLSGDDPDTGADEGFDPMWGRRALYSYLMLQVFRVENKDRLGYFTNLQRLGAGWSFNPTRKTELLLDYMAMFANTNPHRGQPGYSDDGKFRGHLCTGLLKYTFNNFLTGHLRSEFFLPGDYYSPDRRNLALFLRAELWFTL